MRKFAHPQTYNQTRLLDVLVMKDKTMLQFYREQTNLGNTAAAWAAWQSWCMVNEEDPGTLPDFLGRLRRTHEALQRNHRQGGRCPVLRR